MPEAKRAAAPSSPRSIVIVGGGSAGAMAAAYLRAVLPTETGLTLVESPRVATIGVGEGTVPALRDLVAAVGLTDEDLIVHAGATFKLGIRFEDWRTRGSTWWHPFFSAHARFGDERIVDTYAAVRTRTSARDPADSLPPSLDQLSMSWKIASQYRCPRFDESHGDPDGWHPDYAYHFDAARFAELLKKRVAIPGGVRHIVDHVVDVEVDSTDGTIRAIHTERSGRISGDFFVDCTGFRRRLIRAVSDARFISYSDELPCDRAVTTAAARRHHLPLRPYTTATALSSGWMWQIDFAVRTGLGYVYSSRHQSDDDAETELRRVASGLGFEPGATNQLGFEAGHLAHPFVKNCVAVGLAEGFVEPLEATSLGVTARNLKRLAELLCDGQWGADARAAPAYNAAVTTVYDEIKTFLVAHYCLTERRDTTFWRDVARRDASGVRPTSTSRSKTFSDQSWTCLADGFDAMCTIGRAPGDERASPSILSVVDLADAQASQNRAAPLFVQQQDYLDHVTGHSTASSGADTRSLVRTTSPWSSTLDHKLACLDLTSAEAELLTRTLGRTV